MTEGNAAQPLTPTPAQQFEYLLDDLLVRYPFPRQDYAAWFDTLPQRDRHLLVVAVMHGQVCNGGWAQWIENGYQERDMDALRLALARMLPHVPQARVVLEMAGRAATIAGDDEEGDYLTEEAHELLDLLDTHFYSFSDEFEAAFQAYFVAWT